MKQHQMSMGEMPDLVVTVPAAYGQRLVAKFHFGDKRFGRRPVIAWDEAGYALVADMRSGRLTRAAADPVFVGLEPAPLPSKRKPPRRTDASEADGSTETEDEAE